VLIAGTLAVIGRALEAAAHLARRMSKVAVVGAGTMGNGIAHVVCTALAGSSTLVDVEPEALERGLKTISTNIERLVKEGSGEQGAGSSDARPDHGLLQAPSTAKDAEIVAESGEREVRRPSSKSLRPFAAFLAAPDDTRQQYVIHIDH